VLDHDEGGSSYHQRRGESRQNTGHLLVHSVEDRHSSSPCRQSSLTHRHILGIIQKRVAFIAKWPLIFGPIGPMWGGSAYAGGLTNWISTTPLMTDASPQRMPDPEPNPGRGNSSIR